VCAFLAETEAVPESAAAKHEIRSATRDLESRTLQEVPPEHSAHDNFEIPTAHDFAVFAFERDEFSPPVASRLLITTLSRRWPTLVRESLCKARNKSLRVIKSVQWA